MTRTIFRVSLLALLCQAACGEAGDDPSTGTHIGNPVELAFTASSALSAADGRLVARDDEGTDYALTEARVNIRDIDLDLPVGVACTDIEGQLQGARCDSASLKVVVEGPFVVDLLTGAAAPSLSGVRLPPLAWRRVDFRISEARDLPTADTLSGHSFVARADFERGGQVAELRIELKFNEDARVEAPSGVVLPDGGRLVVDFDAGAWFAGLPIGECLEEGDLTLEGGVLILDEDTDCGEAERAIKENIKENTILRGEEG